MYKKSTQKIINRIIFIVIIFAILCGIGIYILKYEVQGETNIPFEITKIAIAQSVNGMKVIKKNGILMFLKIMIYIYIWKKIQDTIKLK